MQAYVSRQRSHLDANMLLFNKYQRKYFKNIQFWGDIKQVAWKVMNQFKCDGCAPPTPNIGHIWVKSFLYFSFLTFDSFYVIIWFFISCINLNFFRMFSRFLLWMLLPLLASAMVREKRLYGLMQFIFMEDNCTELELIVWSSVASHFQCVDICHSCRQCKILLPLSIFQKSPLPLQQKSL